MSGLELFNNGLRSARQLLVAAQTPPEFANAVDAAEVARVYAERAHLGTGAINAATVVKTNTIDGNTFACFEWSDVGPMLLRESWIPRPARAAS